MFIFIIVLTGICLAAGYAAGYYDGKRQHLPVGTPSCGCILCDLKFERRRSHLGHFHQTQHGIAACTRS